MLNQAGNDDPWSELGIVDTSFEQAQEATFRLAKLVRTFYFHLIEQDGIPVGIAGPLTLAYTQSILALAHTNRKPEQ